MEIVSLFGIRSQARTFLVTSEPHIFAGLPSTESHDIPALLAQESHWFLSESGSLGPGQLWLALHELNWELECHTDAPCLPAPTVILISLGSEGQTVLSAEWTKGGLGEQEDFTGGAKATSAWRGF